jgi:membrane protein required for colicin V production
MAMNLLDFCILIPILYFCYRGIRIGFIGEILGIGGIILAVFLTFRYMDNAAGIISSFTGSEPNYLPFVAGAIIFIGTLIVLQIIAFLLKRFLQLIRLNTINRILGLFFGLLKGGIIVSAILILLAGFNQPSKQVRDQSLSYSYIIYLAPWAYNLFPNNDFSHMVEHDFKKYSPIKNFPVIN